MKTWKQKITLLVGSSVVLVVLALWLLAPQESPSAKPTESPEAALEQITNRDPELVFKKAFWRRPQSGDEITHAERHEWVDTESQIAKWQWFITFEPSADTLAWLKTNPFALAPQSTLNASPSDRPSWFPRELTNYQFYRNVNGTHVIAISQDGKTVYATDKGSGIDT